MTWCEANRVDYVFGLARNARLERELATELAEAKRRHLASGAPVRVFRDFRYATLDRLEPQAARRRQSRAQ